MGGGTEPKVKEQMKKSAQTKKNFGEISLKENPSRSHPMKVVVDGEGSPWICDWEVDPSKDLAAQGCWQLKEDGANRSKKRNPNKKGTRTS